MSDWVKVKVPATAANLGAGFDALGMALNLYNTVEVRESQRPNIVITGEGIGKLPCDASNIVLIAAQEIFRAVGKKVTAMEIRLTNGIPLARGLGSSAAARVGAVVAANRLCGDALDTTALLTIATRLEGHPDNVAPALLGGMVICAVDPGGEVHSMKVGIPDPPAFVVLVPDVEIQTADARAVLPDVISREDACFNISRASMLVGALMSGSREYLAAALQDRIHQPYRSRIMPWFSAVVSGAVEAGAYGAVLSGAGSSILAMCSEERIYTVAEAMLQSLRDCGQDGCYLQLRLDTVGAHVVSAPKMTEPL